MNQTRIFKLQGRVRKIVTTDVLLNKMASYKILGFLPEKVLGISANFPQRRPLLMRILRGNTIDQLRSWDFNGYYMTLNLGFHFLGTWNKNT